MILNKQNNQTGSCIITITGASNSFNELLKGMNQQQRQTFSVNKRTEVAGLPVVKELVQSITPSENLNVVSNKTPARINKKRKPKVLPTNLAFNELRANSLPKGEYAIEGYKDVFARKGNAITVMVRIRRQGICKAKDVGKFDGSNIGSLLNDAVSLIAKIETGMNVDIATVGEAFHEFENEINSKQQGGEGDIYRDKKIMAHLGECKLDSVTPSVLLDFLESMDITAGTYNRYLSRVKRIFNTFQRLELISRNPAKGLCKKFETPNPYNSMDESEVQIFVKLLSEDPNPLHANAIKISLLSAIRIGEVISLKKDALNFNDRTITLVKSKNGRRLTFPMGDMVYVILKKLVSESPSEYVFYSDKSKTGHIAHPTECMRRVVKKMHDLGITTKHLVIHSARHTAATLWYAETKDLVKVSRALGHSSLQSTLRYTHTDVSSIREMTNKDWASEESLAHKEV